MSAITGGTGVNGRPLDERVEAARVRGADAPVPGHQQQAKVRSAIYQRLFPLTVSHITGLEYSASEMGHGTNPRTTRSCGPAWRPATAAGAAPSGLGL